MALARKAADPQAMAGARRQVDEAKRELGERGSPWWTDGAPDLNRHLARNTLYAEWFARQDVRGLPAGRTAGHGCPGRFVRQHNAFAVRTGNDAGSGALPGLVLKLQFR